MSLFLTKKNEFFILLAEKINCHDVYVVVTYTKTNYGFSHRVKQYLIVAAKAVKDVFLVPRAKARGNQINISAHNIQTLLYH